MFMIIKSAFLIIMCLVSGIFAIVYYRRIVRECEQRYLKPFNNPSDFWFKIDDLWKESKLPGNEPLHQALIGFGLSNGLLFFVLFLAFILLYQ